MTRANTMNTKSRPATFINTAVAAFILASGLADVPVVMAVATVACAQEKITEEPVKADSAAAEFFEKEVRPILIERCLKCHSEAAADSHGELNLESSAGIAQGGSRGTLVDKSSLDQSLILAAIEYRGTELQMPPAGKLPDSELQILRRWILAGAPTPNYVSTPRKQSEEIDYVSAQSHWAFQPLADVPVPALPADAPDHWRQNPIDAFILQKLNEQQLSPSPPASEHVLRRRLWFDLTGLPPGSPESSHEDDSIEPGNESLIDQLLASPHFGERWARHWLDLARYSEFTPDWQSPTDRGWLYRDWVVQSLNSNMPYDRFVKLQLAADLMPDADVQDLAAPWISGT